MLDLKRFARRVRLIRAWYGLALGGAAGALLGAIWAGLDLFRVWYTNWLALASLVAGGAILGALIGAFLKIKERVVATSVDRRAGLQDRLGTALSGYESSLSDVQRRDAVSKLQSVKASRVYPFRVTKWHIALLIFSGIAACLFIMGNTPLLLNDQQKQDRKDMAKKAEVVEKVAKPLADEKVEEAADAEKSMLRKLEEFSKDLKKGRMTKEEMLQKQNELTKQAEDLQKTQATQFSNATQSAQESLDKMAKSQLEQNGLQNADPGLANKSPRELDDLEKATKQQISDINKMLASGMNKDGKPLSQAEKNALSKQLAAANKQMQSIQLSKRAQEMLRKLAQRPEWKEAMELMKKLQQSAQQGNGQQGQQGQLTEQQLKDLQAQIEALAKQLKDDKAMAEFMKKMLESLRNAKKLGMCQGIGVGIKGLQSMPNPAPNIAGQEYRGSPSEDLYYSGQGHVARTTHPDRANPTLDVHTVTGERSAQGSETYVETKGPSGLGERSKVPYFNVLPKYQRQAEEALKRQQIPKEHQERVKKYFESLQGGGQ